MGSQTRAAFTPKGPGPYLAVVVNNLDLEFMGSLEVALIKGYMDDSSDAAGQTVRVQYLSPFYGATPLKFQKGNKGSMDYGDTQKSYGFWMTPPDIGTKVMIIFADGDYSQGYWIGCIQDKFMNYMTPGIAALDVLETDLVSQATIEKQDLLSLYRDARQSNGKYILPVAEYNKTVASKNTSQSSTNPDSLPRPVHPFAKVLAEQGLLKDPIRGVTSSSARREAPSMVFGFSTPGPLDLSPNHPSGSLKYGGQSVDVPSSRSSGHTFVMDDGEADTGLNRLVRIRSGAGHQILLHDTSGVMYIANAAGTAWIELTENGKIDIYAGDSVSIHTEADFNFRADRDINLDAGRNVNMHAFGDVVCVANGSFTTLANQNIKMTSIGALFVNSNGAINVGTGGELKMMGGAGVDITGEPIRLTGTEIHMKASKVKTSGSIIQNSGSVDNATVPDFEFAESGPVFGINAGGGGTIFSTLQRVPMHEPWDQHETVNTELFGPGGTDVAYNKGKFAPGTTPVSANSTASTRVVVTPSGDIDATGAIKFMPGSGDQAHFAQTTPGFQKLFNAMAVEFKQKTGRPITLNSSFRSFTEQKTLYDLWVANGGRPGNPTVYVPGRGRITTPVNPSPSRPSAHFRGIAADVKEAQELYRMGLLDKYGFTWGGTFRTPDPPHIVLRNPNAGNDE